MHNNIGRGPVNELDLDTNGYPTGNDGTVWATYDLQQAETIRNALVALHITCALKERKLRSAVLYLLHISDGKDLSDAMDFIWREDSGLRLKPDWGYVDGETNKSFERWLSGH